MGQLLFAWAILIFTGAWLWLFDIVFQVVLEIRGIPALSALGAALMLLAVSSILNWLFKAAWEERSRHDSHTLNGLEGPAKESPSDN